MKLSVHLVAASLFFWKIETFEGNIPTPNSVSQIASVDIQEFGFYFKCVFSWGFKIWYRFGITGLRALTDIRLIVYSSGCRLTYMWSDQ